jgi:hypothetical protein
MFFQSYYVSYNENLVIGNISAYKNIMNKFIIKYIQKNKSVNSTLSFNQISNIYYNAIIYSKYYLYWKIYDCVYSDEIMNLLYDIEFLN